MTIKIQLHMNYLKPILIAALSWAILISCERETSLTSYVDTHIGSGGHGHVFVGTNVPFGMVQLGPTSLPEQWDWCSGYHASDSTVIGFSHTHLSGTGIGDLFDCTIMPVVGEVKYARGVEDDPLSGLWAYADRSREVSVPGYYSVPLLRYGVLAELTSTNRVGMHRYSFPSSNEAALVLDLENGGCWDNPTDCFVEKCGDNAIRGWRYSTGWAKEQRVYFYAECSKVFDSVQIISSESGMPLYTRLGFCTKDGEKILFKMALSSVSMEGAKMNMESELPDWDFERVRSDASKLWNEEMGRIRLKSEDENKKKLFYTSLYHTMIAPSTFSDVNYDTRAADGSIKHSLSHATYTTFSLWDAYRAAMPLYSIFQSERYSDFVNTMLDIYDAQGKLPVWHLHGCETDCMVGNPGIVPVADAIVKGVNGVDAQRAFEAIKASAMLPERGQDLRMKYGFIPCELMNESVAYNLEYALADGAVASAAKALGKEEDYKYFHNRSQSYKYNFDAKLGFIRGCFRSGEFRREYSPFASEHRADDYCEGNGWQYTWLVPHDFKGLVDCFGSKSRALEKLDSLFIVPSVIEGGEISPDISGLIGQYAHGNEPSHHVIYFYTMAGQPWKTAQRVHEVLNTLYTSSVDGLAGNEDVGQMSAWYVMSSMGFYQVEPGSDRYWFGTPSFPELSIRLAQGDFTIKAENLTDDNIYIQSITLDGKAYTKPYLKHSDIKAGATLVFKMGPEAKLWYCPDEPQEYCDQRPKVQDRLFSSPAVEREIERVCAQLENPRLAWMFANCFPNTLDTTVHIGDDIDGQSDTFVYTGDIPAMWLRDSGAQVWPYLRYANSDPALRKMIAGVINRQLRCINIDPYANAFNVHPVGAANPTDYPQADPYVFERKWEIDSHCYPIRLAYEYWKVTGDDSIFGQQWVEAIKKILATLHEQQRKEGHGSYIFLRTTDRQLDTKCTVGQGNPVHPVGLIASSFRPSDDATTFEFLIPSNFMAVSSLRKAAEILGTVNGEQSLASECLSLASEVKSALDTYATVEHPKYGKIYAYEVDGFGSHFLMDDANVPSLLAMPYLGDISADDPIYLNTRRFVWSEDNPYFHRGIAGEGIGGPHIWTDVIWPMSIMMKAFTSDDDGEIRDCICQLMTTDAGTGFMHESFRKDNASEFTREWFAWQNTLFGELILKIIDDGRLHVLNSII